MKKYLPYLYLFAPTAIALAHGEEDDGHADPSKRLYVMIALIVVFVAMIGWFVWSKKKK